MLVQVFLASAERVWRRWAKVCGPSRIWGEACHLPSPHTIRAYAPPPTPTALFTEIRQRGRWKRAGPSLWVFSQKVIYSTVLNGYCEVQSVEL